MPKKQTIYLETSVISAYFDFWESNQQQKKETRLLWKILPSKFKLYISDVNLVEIENIKNLNWKSQIKKLIQEMDNLSMTDQIKTLANDYTHQGIIPQSKFNDALHLAAAVLYQMDYLLTWNFRHLSRPYQKSKVFAFNQMHKLHIPIIIEPTELIKEIFI